MASSGIWIAPLIERALNKYLDGQENQIDLEDDGSNLRFAGYTQCSALINTWTDAEGLSMPNITDTKTQIQAKLAQESLEEFNRDYPDQPLNKDRMRGHTINLLEFELVFEYATSEPKVHLYIKRFDIAWEKSKYKGPPKGRIIKRNAQVYHIMRNVFQRTRQRETACTDGADADIVSDCSIKSQNGNRSGYTDLEETLMSQVPPVDSIRAALDTSKQDSKTNAEKRLGVLNAYALLPEAGCPKAIDTIAASTTTKDFLIPRELAEKTNSIQPAVATRHEQPPCLQLPAPVSTEETVGLDESLAAKPSTVMIPGEAMDLQLQNVDKVTSRSTVEKTPSDRDRSTPDPTVPDEENQRESAAKKMTENSNDNLDKPSMDSCTSVTDPWAGMTEILDSDVTIPKDQAELLEMDKRCWIPPEPGHSYPKGNVPPWLLRQWNRIASQRSHRAVENEKKGALEISRSRVSMSPSSTESDSESNVSWSQSDREISPQRVPLQLPLDSSPSIRKSIDRSIHHLDEEENIPTENSPDNAKNQELEQINAKAQQGEQEKLIEPNEAEESSEPAEVPRAVSPEPNGNQSVSDTPEIDHPTTQACTQGHQDKSDRMSEDSVMDTSVPHPLGLETDQPDQDIDSSDPSLPGISTQLRVQVMETPAAHLHRHHLSNGCMVNQDLELNNSEHSSSQVAKSSSQSRILNTYRSSDERKEDEPQDMPHPARPSDSNESNEVDIPATQLSGGNWSYRDTTVFSNSAVVMNTSELGQHEASINLAESSGQTEESSHPFSSYRETLFVQTDEENQSIPSPTQYTPGKPCGYRLQLSKRRASEIETEQVSPIKRQKMTDCKEMMDSTKELASNIMSRRQTYIENSVEYAEAQKVYEKFRSDYPVYTGDFDHFAMVCSKLQSLRAQGSLKRSFLWDDFVIMHLRKYPHYQEQTFILEGESMPYEEYFLSNFSKPAYKKRSLTATGIEISATQHVSSSASVAPTIPQQGMKISFTGSLVDRFTNLHARSFGAETLDLSPENDAYRLSRNSLPLDREREADSDSVHKDDSRVETEAGVLMDVETTPVSTSREDFHSATIENLSSTTFPGTQSTSRTNPSVNVLREQDDNRSIPESEYGQDEVEDPMDETHEVASVELGDPGHEPSSTAQEQLSDAESDAVSEAGSFEENWVTWHIRQLQRSGGPFWSDSPNTPFKIFARADANVLSERMRRGGVPLPVDDKGVIQPLAQYSIPPVREFLNRVGNPVNRSLQESQGESRGESTNNQN